MFLILFTIIIIKPLAFLMKNEHSINSHLIISQFTISTVNEQDKQGKNNDPVAFNQDGSCIVGHYLLGKQIGSGSFGKVHLGMHLPTNEKVGIKIIKKDKLRNRDISRVKSEIQILRKVRHRHVIHLYEIIQTHKSILLITEYMPNGQLFKHILDQKKLSEQQACIYFQQIMSAVQYLHDQGIAHRDIKPQNILIDYDRQLKLIDFGLSSQYQKNQHLKSFCGSPCYAAPEILSAKRSYSPLEADIWSCGVILYTMICGYLPFCDSNTFALYKKILQCKLKFPTFISASSRNLIENILTLNPKKRYTIKQIKSHELFNNILPKPTFGLRKDQHIPINTKIIQQLSTHKSFTSQKFIQSLSSHIKNQHSSAYYILMKKKVRNKQKIEEYIGNDNFNDKLITRKQQKEEKQMKQQKQTKQLKEQKQEGLIQTNDVIKPEVFQEVYAFQSHLKIDSFQAGVKSKPEDAHQTNQSIAGNDFHHIEGYNELIGPRNLQEQEKRYQQRLSFYKNNYSLLKKRQNFEEIIFSISQKLQFQKHHKIRYHKLANPQKKNPDQQKEMLWINMIYNKSLLKTLQKDSSMSTLKSKSFVKNNKTIQIQRFLPTINNKTFVSKIQRKQK